MMEKKYWSLLAVAFPESLSNIQIKKPVISESLKSVQDEGREEVAEQSGGMMLS